MSTTTSPENAGSPARVRQPRSDRTAHRAAEAVKDQIHWHTRYASVPMNLIRPAHGHPTGSLSLARDKVAPVAARLPLSRLNEVARVSKKLLRPGRLSH